MYSAIMNAWLSKSWWEYKTARLVFVCVSDYGACVSFEFKRSFTLFQFESLMPECLEVHNDGI